MFTAIKNSERKVYQTTKIGLCEQILHTFNALKRISPDFGPACKVFDFTHLHPSPNFGLKQRERLQIIRPIGGNHESKMLSNLFRFDLRRENCQTQSTIRIISQNELTNRHQRLDLHPIFNVVQSIRNIATDLRNIKILFSYSKLLFFMLLSFMLIYMTCE